MEQSDENISSVYGQETSKRLIPSHSSSDNGIKEELMYCQSCSYGDVLIERLKLHIFREHPTEAAYVANSLDEANQNLHDLRLFCVKESCTFSTALWNIYEKHLMSCCRAHETLSETERDRLRSTIKFILQIHDRCDSNKAFGFLDFVFSVDSSLTCNDEDGGYFNSSSMLTDSDSNFEDSANPGGGSGSTLNLNISLPPFQTSAYTTENTGIMDVNCKTEIDDKASSSEGEEERSSEELTKEYPVNMMALSMNEEGSTLLHSSDNNHSDFPNYVAGTSIDGYSSTEETRTGTKVNAMHAGKCFNKDMDVSTHRKLTEKFPRMTPNADSIGHRAFTHNDTMKPISNWLLTNLPSNSDDLHSDSKTERVKKPFKCDVCEKAFGHNSKLIEHKRIHTGEKPFQCNECGQSFTHSTTLIRHMTTHTGEKPFKCDECGKSFSRNGSLAEHIKIHTGEKPFKCEECGKTFSNNSKYLIHKRTHTGEKPFECNECGKAFSHSNSLIRHLTTHTGEKPFKCSECGNDFGQYSYLVKHMRTHTGEKPFDCKVCGKTFSRSSSLIKHMTTHSGEKPFECKECGKTFGRSSSLIPHMRTHTGERPFECDECGRTFTQNNSLIEHRRTHTGERPFKCNDCGRTFGQNRKLVQHVKKTHAVIESSLRV